MALNSTASNMALSSVSSGTMAMLIALILFVGLIVVLFVLVKNFRRFLYGLGVSIPVALIGWMSWGIASPIKDGNWNPLKWTLGVVCGIGIMIIIGSVVEKAKIFKAIEKKIFEGGGSE